MADSVSDATSAILEKRRAAGAEAPLPGTRAWFAFFVLWMVTLAALALAMFDRYERGQAEASGLWLLALMCFYLSLCSALLPLPTAWIILFAAGPEAGLAESGMTRIVLVALFGALATVVANLTEYHGLSWLLRHGLGRRVRQARIYQWGVRWFDKAPFQALTLVGFVPIPIDAIRWLAILRRYPRVRFALAYFFGRGARYTLLAGLSVMLGLTPIQILGIQIGLVLLAVCGRILWPLAARWRHWATRAPVNGSSAE